MKLLFVLENYMPHIGGVEIVFKNLCEGLAARGHEVRVVTHRLPGTRRRETLKGVDVVRVRCLDSRYLFTFASVPAVLKYAKECDVIHTTTFNGAPPAWLAGVMRKKPVLITVHETWIGKWREYTEFSWLRAKVHDLLERAVFLLPYTRYACVSESTRRNLLRVIPRRRRIVTVHNGFDPAPWEKRHDTRGLRKRLGLQGAFVVFGYGRPGASKGFRYLLEASTQIGKRIPNARIVLMLSRDRQYAHAVKEYRRRWPNVRFLDPRPYAELPQYVQMADCVVIPSLSEGFGYTTLESVAAGTPVVATDTTSIPEVISGKHLLVPPKDPEAIADAVLKVKEGQYKNTPIKRFPWKDAIEGYLREYESIVVKHA
jgi:glycosyltransferase involved in cell wall biosynthesis